MKICIVSHCIVTHCNFRTQRVRNRNEIDFHSKGSWKLEYISEDCVFIGPCSQGIKNAGDVFIKAGTQKSGLYGLNEALTELGVFLKKNPVYPRST